MAFWRKRNFRPVYWSSQKWLLLSNGPFKIINVVSKTLFLLQHHEIILLPTKCWCSLIALAGIKGSWLFEQLGKLMRLSLVFLMPLLWYEETRLLWNDLASHPDSRFAPVTASPVFEPVFLTQVEQQHWLITLALVLFLFYRLMNQSN